MANPHKGDLGFDAEIAGEDGVKQSKHFTLCYSTDAICQAEEVLNLSLLEIGQEMRSWEKSPNRIRTAFVRALFWAGLTKHHPEIDLKAAGELMIEAGGMLPIIALVGEAFARAYPKPEPGARPQRARRVRNGTGRAS